MAIDAIMTRRPTLARLLVFLFLGGGLAGCGTGPLIGLVYTHVRMPLTRDLHATVWPPGPPHSDRIVEVKEPFSGLGFYARVNSNALGDIARQSGLERLYFADQEVVSVLGIWKSHRVLLYGDAGGDEGHPHGH